jgi:CBS domain-containing protein
MRLHEIMNTAIITIGPGEAASAAWSRMQREGIRHLVVTEGKRLLGVLSERDLGGAKGAAVRSGRTVRDLMAQKVASAKPSTTLRQAANLMRGRLIGSLPVVEDGRVVGIVTATDVLEELGRGSSRPAVRAKRQPMRLPPASARRAAAKRASEAKRGSRKKKGAKAPNEPGEGGGERVRQPDSAKRAPLPAYIRSVGAMLDTAGQDYLRRKLGRKLGKFGSSIERASVRVEDVNGPRGGVDKRLRIKVVLSGLPSVVIDERHHSLQAAMDRALARAERAVRQAAQRRRTKSLRPRRSAAGAQVP